MISIKRITICLIILCSAAANAQTNNSSYFLQSYFRSPLAIATNLSANFGEVRKNHYHMGLDYRTLQKENLPVFASEEGYISRISVQQGGYGRAIYITHPAGYITLYAHLNKFYEPLEAYLREEQYKSKSWEQDITLPANLFRIVKGGHIALSGNTGSSEGPHLHFEIRNATTNNALNPQLFGLLEDNMKPIIDGLFWYDRRTSTYETKPNPIAIKKKGGTYVSVDSLIKINARVISFGIKAEDKTLPSSFRFGIYTASVHVDGLPYFSFTLDSISHSNTRYSNACIDYDKFVNGRSVIQHISKLPGNNLPVFAGSNNGVIYLNDDNPHDIAIEIKDVAGNTAIVKFPVQYYNSSGPNTGQKNDSLYKMIPNRVNKIETNNVKVNFSRYAFYDTVSFVLKTATNNTWPYASESVTLHNKSVPVHNNYDVSLKLSPYAQFVMGATGYKDKILMRLREAASNTIVRTTTMDNLWYKGSLQNLGIVELLVDNIAPIITPAGWNKDSLFGTKNAIRINCKDEVSGIKKFNVLLDRQQWLLFRPVKGGGYIYNIDEYCPVGQHTLTVTAEDLAGNITTKIFGITVKEGVVEKGGSKKSKVKSKKEKIKKKK